MLAQNGAVAGQGKPFGVIDRKTLFTAANWVEVRAIRQNSKAVFLTTRHHADYNGRALVTLRRIDKTTLVHTANAFTADLNVSEWGMGLSETTVFLPETGTSENTGYSGFIRSVNADTLGGGTRVAVNGLNEYNQLRFLQGDVKYMNGDVVGVSSSTAPWKQVNPHNGSVYSHWGLTDFVRPYDPEPMIKFDAGMGSAYAYYREESGENSRVMRAPMGSGSLDSVVYAYASIRAFGLVEDGSRDLIIVTGGNIFERKNQNNVVVTAKKTLTGYYCYGRQLWHTAKGNMVAFMGKVNQLDKYVVILDMNFNIIAEIEILNFTPNNGDNPTLYDRATNTLYVSDNMMLNVSTRPFEFLTVALGDY